MSSTALDNPIRVFLIGPQGACKKLYRFAASLASALILSSILSAAPQFTVQPTITPNSNSKAPQAAILHFETKGPVSATLQAVSEDHRFEVEYGPDQSPANGLPIVGMRANRDYRFTISISDSSGATSSPQELSHRSPQLPDRPDLMPRIVTETLDPRAMANGFTLFNPRRRIPIQVEDAISASSEFNENLGMLIVVDDAGEVVWYYHGDSRITDYRPIANGNIAFITSDNRLIEIDLLGNTVASWYAKDRPQGKTAKAIPVDSETFHHSFQEYPNGDFLILGTEIRELPNYYTSETNPDAARKTQKVVGDTVMRFTRQGEVVWKWNAFEHLDPYQIGYLSFSSYWVRRGFPDTVDWSHANGVRIIDDGQSFLVNFRLISGIAKVDVASQAIQWFAISEPDSLGPEVAGRALKLPKDQSWFWMPHAPWITERGTLLIFNNDNFGARPFGDFKAPGDIRSRAEEYALDEETMSLSKVWESRFPGEQPMRSWAMGSVQPLSNGNTLVGYGLLLRPEGVEGLTWPKRLTHPAWTQIREYTHDSPASLVWSLTLLPLNESTPIGWSIYGGLRLPSWPATNELEP